MVRTHDMAGIESARGEVESEDVPQLVDLYWRLPDWTSRVLLADLLAPVRSPAVVEVMRDVLRAPLTGHWTDDWTEVVKISALGRLYEEHAEQARRYCDDRDELHRAVDSVLARLGLDLATAPPLPDAPSAEATVAEIATRAPLAAYVLEVGTEPLDRPARNSVGGWPFLDEGQEWPECFCGERMSLFFQLDLPDDLGPFGGDHLLVFHCRAHNDASNPELSDEGRLVPRYWDAPQPPHPRPFWRVLLQRDAAQPAAQPEPAVRALPLTLRPFTDAPVRRGRGARMFKVGGRPSWAQSPESYRCACGAELVYMCQVPEHMEFVTHSGQPEQPYGVGTDMYNLFLGNEVYLLACPAHCDPAAVWPVNQN
ncbi:hypothetical protein [Streptomyces sp. MUM 136J]|uniref:hypothetical protein n=1 Tax=Streptomyces sp. MUM 136J TaxID=2791992 RepID=UPI001F04C9E5|nr:hypothetical protein [Streptomyces sp. MUM 136J]